LDELMAVYPQLTIHYWRDKSGREIDFVVERSQGRADTIEAKINPGAFNPDALREFRGLYPHGANYLISPFVKEPYTIRVGGFAVNVCNTADMRRSSKPVLPGCA
jgi:hypothetical protein